MLQIQAQQDLRVLEDCRAFRDCKVIGVIQAQQELRVLLERLVVKVLQGRREELDLRDSQALQDNRVFQVRRQIRVLLALLDLLVGQLALQVIRVI
jgi:hypothetical protein